MQLDAPAIQSHLMEKHTTAIVVECFALRFLTPDDDTTGHRLGGRHVQRAIRLAGRHRAIQIHSAPPADTRAAS